MTDAPPRFTHVHEKRLLKHAQFLREKVPRRAFDFSVVMRGGEKGPLGALAAGGGCGTVGCAIGWMPARFPRDFRWQTLYGEHLSVVNKRTNDENFYAASKFFRLSIDETKELFTPSDDGYTGSDGRWRKPSHTCDSSATPKQVARHIERFVAKKRKGEA